MPEIRMTMAQYRRQRCELDGRKIRLTLREREMVAVLLIRRGRWVEYEAIADAIWPAAWPDTWRCQIRNYVQHLRRKLPGVIRLWWGVGFMIPCPDEEPAALAA